MTTLHIMRNFDTALYDETADPAAGDQVLLIQDAVLNPKPFSCPVSVCCDDLAARNTNSDHPSLDYDAIRDLMLAHDKVILW